MAGRILICDDEKNMRLTVTTALESEGYTVQSAVNGEDALKQLENESFNLLLLDLKMPGIDGLEVMRRLNIFLEPPKVVIISAHGSIDLAVKAMKLGAVDFIQKPFSPNEIRQTVSRALETGATAGADASLDYNSRIARTIELIHNESRDEALQLARRALYENPHRPEAYNLMGVLNELKRNLSDAQKFYRTALEIDPSYAPAQNNLDRTCSQTGRGKIVFG